MDMVCDKAAEAVNEAIDRLQPASIKIATGEAKGKIAYNYYAPDLYDRRMSVIQAKNARGQDDRHAGQLRGPPRGAGQRRRHPQPRPGRAALRDDRGQAGGIALFMNGAQGGMVTADNRNLDQPSDPASRLLERRPDLGGMPADRPADGPRGHPDRQGRPRAERPALFCDALDVSSPSSRPQCGP